MAAHVLFAPAILPTSISALAWVYNYEKLRDTFKFSFDRQAPQPREDVARGLAIRLRQLANRWRPRSNGRRP